MNEPAPPDDAAHPASFRRRLTEPSFLFLLVFATSTGIACYALKGPAVFWTAFREHLWLLIAITPVLAGAVLLGAFIQALVPPARPVQRTSTIFMGCRSSLGHSPTTHIRARSVSEGC